MALLLVFYLYRGSHIETESKGTKVGDVLLMGCSFINQISNCIRLWKGIGKSDSMVQSI